MIVTHKRVKPWCWTTKFLLRWTSSRLPLFPIPTSVIHRTKTETKRHGAKFMILGVQLKSKVVNSTRVRTCPSYSGFVLRWISRCFVNIAPSEERQIIVALISLGCTADFRENGHLDDVLCTVGDIWGLILSSHSEKMLLGCVFLVLILRLYFSLLRPSMAWPLTLYFRSFSSRWDLVWTGPRSRDWAEN